VSQAVVEDPPSSRAKKPSAADKKSGSTRKSSPGVLSRYQKDTQYAQAAHLEGVRQGWPLARLLDQLPPIPDKDAINMSTARPHLQLYETLVDCGRLHNALELLRALKTAGLNTVGGRVSNKAFLRQCARRSAVAVAFDFVSFVDYPDVRLYNMLLSVCASAADSRSAFAAFVMMYDNGVQPDVMAYTTLISACAKAGELEKAFETFRRMEMDGLEGNVVTYGALMDALSRRVMELTKASIHKKRSLGGPNGESAIGSATVGDDAGADWAKLSAEIDGGEVAATLRRCFDLREEMDDAGVAPDGTMINTILSACGRAAEVRALSADALQKAFDLYDEMESSDEADLAPDAYTYSALIKACVNAGQSMRGLSLYDRAMDPSAGIEPSIMVFQEAMIACSHLADLGKAWAIWEDMRVERVAPDAMLYATLIAVAGRAGKREEAERVVFEMERAGVAPTPEVFASLAGIAARAGDGAGVESAIAEVASRGLAVPLEMYNALVTAAARRGDVDAAQEAVLRLRAAGFACDGDTYHALMRAAGSAIRPDLAWHWYEEAKATGTVEITRHHFTMLVIASGRGGDMDKMFEAEAEMRAAGLEPDEQTWCELLSSCARHGDASLTWDTYKRSRKAGQPPSEVALNILIGVTLLKIRALTDPDDRRNIKRMSQWDQDDDSAGRKKEEPEWTEWADRAIAAYHEATVAGVRPRLATFSAMLACLRPPTLPSLRAVDRETRPGSKAESLARAVSHEDSSHEDARKYYPLRALIMYEEAQAIGVVPKFATETDSVYDIRKFPPAAAEVAVLTMLRVFRRRSDAHAGAGDDELPNVTLRVLSDEEHEEMIASGDDEGRRLAQTGDRVIVLLRRLRFNYGGSLSAGRIELSGHVIKRWLQAKPPKDERAPGVEAGLRQNLQDQARNIRMQSFDDSDGSGYGGGATDWGAIFGRRGGGAGGGSSGGAGRGRGLGAGSDIDFFGASDNRYSNDSGDSGEYSYRPRKNRWVNTGWDNDEKVDDCMMGELTRIITKDGSGGGSGSGSFDSGSGDSGSGDVRYSRDGDW
jgi:pentatricopeptide repeat protein